MSKAAIDVPPCTPNRNLVKPDLLITWVSWDIGPQVMNNQSFWRGVYRTNPPTKCDWWFRRNLKAIISSCQLRKHSHLWINECSFDKLWAPHAQWLFSATSSWQPSDTSTPSLMRNQLGISLNLVPRAGHNLVARDIGFLPCRFGSTTGRVLDGSVPPLSGSVSGTKQRSKHRSNENNTAFLT